MESDRLGRGQGWPAARGGGVSGLATAAIGRRAGASRAARAATQGCPRTAQAQAHAGTRRHAGHWAGRRLKRALDLDAETTGHTLRALLCLCQIARPHARRARLAAVRARNRCCNALTTAARRPRHPRPQPPCLVRRHCCGAFAEASSSCARRFIAPCVRQDVAGARAQGPKGGPHRTVAPRAARIIHHPGANLLFDRDRPSRSPRRNGASSACSRRPQCHRNKNREHGPHV
jgi:hypothetical protein